MFRRGKRRRTRHLDVFVAESPVSRPRLALVVPRHGHEIVERNRLKRRLRECARTQLLPGCLTAGVAVDVLLRARAEAYAATFHELRDEIGELVQQVCSRGS